MPNDCKKIFCLQSYIRITGTDLVLEVDSNNQVICNTKSTSNDNQLWRLKYSWTDGNFQISAKSQQSMMMAYDHDLSLAVVHLSSGSTNIWKGDGNSVCTPRSHYLTTNGNTTAGSQVIISTIILTNQPLQLDLLPQIYESHSVYHNTCIGFESKNIFMISGVLCVTLIISSVIG